MLSFAKVSNFLHQSYFTINSMPPIRSILIPVRSSFSKPERKYEKKTESFYQHTVQLTLDINCL